MNILLTGVSRGLGLAMCEGFIERGHTVLGCSRSREQIESLRKRFAGSHQFEVVDVVANDAVAEWAKKILANGAPPDLLINNAAVINANAPLWKVPVEEFDRVIDVNIKGIANVLRHFLPAMVARRHGVIVNFSSGWGRSTSPEVAPYCATKYAVEGLTQALAQELPQGMAAVPLNPGVINTEMLQSCYSEHASKYPKPAEWARRAVPFVLALGPKDNGASLAVPGEE